MKKSAALAKLLIPVVFLVHANLSLAAGWTGNQIKILKLGSGTDGNIIFTDQTFNEGCSAVSAVRIDDNSPNLDRIWSLAMMAYATNKKVQFYLTGTCLGMGAKAVDIKIGD